MYEHIRWTLIYLLLALAMKLTRASDEKTAILLNVLAQLFGVNPKAIERALPKTKPPPAKPHMVDYG